MAIGYETAQPQQHSNGSPSFQELIAGMRSSVQVDWKPDSLRISEEWFRWEHPIALAAVAMLIGVPVAMSSSFDWREIQSGDEPVPIWFLSLVGLGVGSLFYWAIAGIANSTKLTVKGNRIERKSGPLPWLGYFDLSVDQIDQFYVVQRFIRRRRASPWDWTDDPRENQGPDYGGFSLEYSKKIAFYQLVVQLKNRQIRNVSIRYNDPYTPRVMEAMLEHQLGIEDRFVSAEFRG